MSGRVLTRPDIPFRSHSFRASFRSSMLAVEYLETFPMCIRTIARKLLRTRVCLLGRMKAFSPEHPSVRLNAGFILVLLLVLPQFATCQTSEQQIEESFRSGQAALKQREYAQAIEEFKKVLAIDPTLLEAEVNLGLAYQSLSEYDLAVPHLSKALRERPSLLALNVIVGMDYLKLGSPEKAIPFLQHALKLDPSNRDAHEALSLSYLGQEKYQAAAEEFRQMALLDADQPDALFKLGHEYLDLAARLAYRGARLYPDSAWGHRFLGDLLFQRSRWEEAAQEYYKALAVEPREEGLDTSLGQAFLHGDHFENADSEFHAELRLDSSDQLAWLGLAELALRKG